MSFLHFAMLGGAAFVAVPIVLHLIMRQRPRHIEFPALRFVQQCRDANRRRLRLRHLLLLALRCAVIVLVALAVARPRIQATGMLASQEAPVAAALVFDTNPRMDYRHQNQTRLEVARETAKWLVAQLPSDSDVAVFDSRDASGAFAPDPRAARRRLDRLAAITTAEPLPILLEDALRLVKESDKPRKEVYLFTDLARASWPVAAQQSLERRLKESSDVAIYVIDVGVAQPRNFGLSELRLSNQVLPRNTPLQVQVEAVHRGPADQRVVELFVGPTGEEPISRGQSILSFQADQSQQAQFSVLLKPGVYQGYVRIAGQDGLTWDDKRYFTVEVKPPWRILLAAPAKAADYALFLAEALAPRAMRLKGDAAFECDTIELDKLAKKDLKPYAAVCLLDPKPMAAETWAALSKYAAAGGGVAIFLGRNAQPVEAFNDAAAQELLPGRLLRQWRAGERDVWVAPEDLQHPLLAKFRPLGNSVPWSGFPVFRHWQLGPLNAGVQVVIPYSNNLPALLDKPVGSGRVLTMTTPVSDPASRRDTWNLLPTADEPWPFVMLANEMMFYLVGSREVQLNYQAGETASLPLPRGQQVGSFLVSMPQSDPVRQAVDETKGVLMVTGTDVVGNYRAVAGGEDRRISLGFSVNVRPDVTQFDRLDQQQLKELLGGAPFRIAHSREEIDRSVSTGRVGQELYPLLVVLLALVLAGEQILSNRFYRHDLADDVKTSTRATSAAPAEAKTPQTSAETAVV